MEKGTNYEPQPPVDDNHALLIGAVAMALQVGFARSEAFRYQVALIDTPEGVHTDTLLIEAPSGRYEVRVKKV